MGHYRQFILSKGKPNRNQMGHYCQLRATLKNKWGLWTRSSSNLCLPWFSCLLSRKCAPHFVLWNPPALPGASFMPTFSFYLPWFIFLTMSVLYQSVLCYVISIGIYCSNQTPFSIPYLSRWFSSINTQRLKRVLPRNTQKMELFQDRKTDYVLRTLICVQSSKLFSA